MSTLQHTAITLTATDKLAELCQNLAANDVPAEAVWNSQFPQQKLTYRTVPWTEELVQVRNQLEHGAHAVVLHGTHVDVLHNNRHPQAARLAAITIAAYMGNPTETDASGTIAWPVTPKPDRAGNTFSERYGTAPWHTDSVFKAHPGPERYFGLFCIQQAQEGGCNGLLPASAVIAALAAANPEVLATLQEPYAFDTPASFAHRDTGITQAPVIDTEGQTIRYRHDMMLPNGDEQRQALDVLRNVIRTLASKLCNKADYILLKPGDALIVANHRTLHSRTEFSGPRHLLRVRTQ